jgi:ABC-type transporter Mla MlaB component
MKVAKKKRAAATPLTVVASSDAAGHKPVSQVIDRAMDVPAAESAPVFAAPAAAAAPESTVTLGSNCTVKDAAALKLALCAVVETPGAVTLDVGSLERIDTATVQVLCAFVLQRVATARAVKWLGVSEVLREAARLLGVQPLLSLPPAEALS